MHEDEATNETNETNKTNKNGHEHEPASQPGSPPTQNSPPGAIRTRTRVVAFAEIPASPPRSLSGSDSEDSEGQLKMPRPSQRVREEEELWQRRKERAEAGGDTDESSEDEGGVLGELDEPMEDTEEE